ncbi:hypothetical protein Hanom_Chr17g01558031 [Helianthus anomalus]
MNVSIYISILILIIVWLYPYQINKWNYDFCFCYRYCDTSALPGWGVTISMVNTHILIDTVHIIVQVSFIRKRMV